MTANVSSHYAGSTPSRHTGVRVLVGVLGLAAVVLGIVLLFQPVAAARTLALLVGLSFVVGGLLEIAVGWAGAEQRRWSSLVLGAVLVLGGVLAIVWPGITLFSLALITGLSLIVHGATRVGIAVVGRAEIPGWGWLALAGAVNVFVGLLAILWPEATVLVLSLVLGAQIAVFGVLLLVAAFWHPGAREATPTGS
ncbi:MULTISPECIES: HdeD family acid-resistance protein [unclassified Geodermatophilus]|uniref:HdeD family acid-resistance protein n=1 Tax=unclassified Geodermatophilus TaxID=2637632 RepID=UPI003EEC971F